MAAWQQNPDLMARLRGEEQDHIHIRDECFEMALSNPRHNQYSLEAAADRAAHPMAKSALLLQAARVHRDNARARIAAAKSCGSPVTCHDYRNAYEAIDWATIAVARAAFYRRQAASLTSAA